MGKYVGYNKELDKLESKREIRGKYTALDVGLQVLRLDLGEVILVYRALGFRNRQNVVLLAALFQLKRN